MSYKDIVIKRFKHGIKTESIMPDIPINEKSFVTSGEFAAYIFYCYTTFDAHCYSDIRYLGKTAVTADNDSCYIYAGTLTPYYLENISSLLRPKVVLSLLSINRIPDLLLAAAPFAPNQEVTYVGHKFKTKDDTVSITNLMSGAKFVRKTYKYDCDLIVRAQPGIALFAATLLPNAKVYVPVKSEEDLTAFVQGGFMTHQYFIRFHPEKIPSNIIIGDIPKKFWPS